MPPRFEYRGPSVTLRLAPSWTRPWRVAPIGGKFYVLKKGWPHAHSGPFDTIDAAMALLKKFTEINPCLRN